MQPRIKDIADYLGVSTATVSMVLNNRPGFSESTRARVAEAVKILGYQGSTTKRLAAEPLNHLPFVIYRRHGEVIGETAFFSSLIESIENEAKNNGYDLSVHYLSAKDPGLSESFRLIAAKSHVGLLVLGTEMDQSDAAPLLRAGVPFVLMDNAMPGLSCNKILMDNLQGAFLAVRHLWSAGHRRIGHLHSNIWISNFEERELGYRYALRKHGLPLREDWIPRIGSTPQSAYRDMCAYLDQTQIRDLPTAFFADNDIIAAGAIRALKERGLRIPKDLSVVGFDDTPYCTMLSPNLSTMRVNTKGLGSGAVQLLLNGQEDFRKILMETELVSRESVRVLDPKEEQEEQKQKEEQKQNKKSS